MAGGLKGFPLIFSDVAVEPKKSIGIFFVIEYVGDFELNCLKGLQDLLLVNEVC